MPRANPAISSFNSGEISPLLFGRVDQEKYYSSCAVIENAIITPYGPLTKTPGNIYVGEVKDSSKKTRIIKFSFSTTQSYALELGDEYMRVFKDGGRVLESEVDISGISKSDPAVVTTTGAHGYSNGDWVYISGVTGMTEANGKYYKVASATTDTFELQDTDGNDIDSSGYTAYSSGGTSEKVYEISTPWTEDQVFGLQYAQSADVMWIVHPSHKPRELTRSGHTNWTISNYTPTADPFTGSDDYPSCVALFQQRLWFANTNNDPQKLFGTKSGDYDDMTTGSNDDDAVTYTIGSEEENAIRWLSPGRVLIAGTSGGGFSLSGGSPNEAVTPTNISVSKEVTYGVAKVLPQKIGNFVYYVQRNSKTLREMKYSYAIDAYEALNLTLFSPHIAGQGLVEMAYQQSPYNILWCVRSDGQLSTLTRQIEHDVVGWSRQVTDGDYESVTVIPGDAADDEVWVVVKRTIDGTTRRFIEYFHEFQDFSWDDQEDAFFVHSGLELDDPVTITNATAADPVVITTSGAHGFSDDDEIIIRGVEGMTEINDRKFTVASATTDTFELSGEDGSAHTAYSSGGEARACVTTISGLDHLEGKDVNILVDGAVHPQKTVSGGSITLDWSGGQIVAGLPYTVKIKPVRIEAGTTVGTAQGRKKKMFNVSVRLHQSLGMSVGPPDNEDEVQFRTTSMDMDEAVPLFTGDKKTLMRGGYTTDGYVQITQSSPTPLTVIGLILEVNTSEG